MISFARKRYNHHNKQWPMWGDDREWKVWDEKRDRLYLEMIADPEEQALNEAIKEQRRLAAIIKPASGPLENNMGKPGYNEHGVPLHACAGHIQDAHYWEWLKAKRLAKENE